jgi:Holliday junction resolvasome RuvABC endonuclease subunit
MKKQRRVLGIDPATKCGLADTYGMRRLVDLNLLSAAMPEHLGSRHAALLEVIDQQLTDRDYDAVGIEEASYGAGNNMQTLSFHGQLLGVVAAVCARKRVPLIKLGPTEVKKFATGSGSADKKQMIGAARLSGETITDDNIADAFWVMELTKLRLANASLGRS